MIHYLFYDKRFIGYFNQVDFVYTIMNDSQMKPQEIRKIFPVTG